MQIYSRGNYYSYRETLEFIRSARGTLGANHGLRTTMNEKDAQEVPEITTPYRLIGLILLWVFILLWIAPLASFALPASVSGL
jgi:hypothetical protein